MIYTVTFNPAIDYVVHFDHLRPGEINRNAINFTVYIHDFNARIWL